MIESNEEQLDERDAPTEGSNKPLAWFFIIMILLNPFLAPLLSLLLKANIEPKVTVLDDETPEAEPEIPWDFFEQDFFHNIDRMLSFPMASAASLPIPESRLHREFPEFLEGTTQHPPKKASALDATMEIIHRQLFDFLKTPSDKAKIIVLGEEHTESWFRKINVLAYLKQWQRIHPTVKITVVVENVDAEGDDDKLLRDTQNLFDHIHFHSSKPSETYKHDVEVTLSKNCLTKDFTDTGNHMYCFVQALRVYQFDIIMAYSDSWKHKNDIHLAQVGKPLVKNSHFDSQREFLFRKREIALHTHNQRVQQKLSASDLILDITGLAHLQGLDADLKTLNTPYRLINLDTTSTFLNNYFESEGILEKACVVPREKCPPFKNPANTVVTHCALLQEPYTEKKCDAKVNAVFKNFMDRKRFIEANPSKVPPLPWSERPRRLTDFFATKTSVDFVQNEFEEKDSENSQNLPGSPLHKLYPEFLTGTNEHPKEIADAMDANMKVIAPPIISFLAENEHEKVVVLGIAERHDHIGLLTTNVFATIKTWQEHHPNTNITVIRELWNPSPEFNQQVNQAFTRFHAPNTDEKSADYKKELDTLLSTHCFNTGGLLTTCATLSAKARQFDFTFTTTSLNQTPEQEKQFKKQEALANSYRHPTGDIRFLDITKTTSGQVTNDDQFPHEIKLIDRRITKTIRDTISAHKYPNPHQQLMLVVWFGSTHALGVSNMLDAAKIPYRLLNMRFDSAHIHETKERYATSCILPKDKCPAEILEFAQKQLQETKETMTFRHCVLPVPYDEKQCDRVLHESNKLFTERNKFSRKIAHQIPPFLPTELPHHFRGRKISYFFATEKSVKYVQEEIARQKIEQDREKLRAEL